MGEDRCHVMKSVARAEAVCWVSYGAWYMEPSGVSLFTPSPPPFNPPCFIDIHNVGFKTPTTQEAQRSGYLARVDQDVRLRHRNADDIDTNIVLMRRGELSVVTPDIHGFLIPISA